MTGQQRDCIKEFEREVRSRGDDPEIDWKESINSESRGVLFGDFMGVTLMVYPDGLINIPARCSWSFDKYTHVTAAASAKELWAGQKRRDDANPGRAKKRSGGHLGPIVAPNLKCQIDDCPCQTQSQEGRRKRARGAFNSKKP